jgi:hypothetical protein
MEELMRFVLPVSSLVSRLILTLVLCVFVAGCASHDTKTSVSVAVPQPLEGLGRTAIIYRDDPTEPALSDPVQRAEFETIVTASLAQNSGVDLVEPDLLQAAAKLPVTVLSDYEAVLAGRRAGIDTVVFVLPEFYRGSVSVGLSLIPISGQVAHAYVLRVIDVASGSLKLETRRERITTVSYGFPLKEDLRSGLRDDLADLNAGEARAADRL